MIVLDHRYWYNKNLTAVARTRAAGGPRRSPNFTRTPPLTHYRSRLRGDSVSTPALGPLGVFGETHTGPSASAPAPAAVALGGGPEGVLDGATVADAATAGPVAIAASRSHAYQALPGGGGGAALLACAFRSRARSSAFDSSYSPASASALQFEFHTPTTTDSSSAFAFSA